MSNTNEPVTACVVKASEQGKALGYDKDHVYLGLTKREHFAGLAPDNIPTWFHQVFSENADPKLTWHREGNDFQIGECGWTQEGEVALYFAWRTYYADELLKQLENKGG